MLKLGTRQIVESLTAGRVTPAFESQNIPRVETSMGDHVKWDLVLFQKLDEELMGDGKQLGCFHRFWGIEYGQAVPECPRRTRWRPYAKYWWPHTCRCRKHQIPPVVEYMSRKTSREFQMWEVVLYSQG